MGRSASSVIWVAGFDSLGPWRRRIGALFTGSPYQTRARTSPHVERDHGDEPADHARLVSTERESAPHDQHDARW